MEKGLIFNIQKMSIQDGPGIRTTVFFKGCPLRCLWCANPESQNRKKEIAFFHGKCVQCGYCTQICPVQAIAGANQMFSIHREQCIQCLQCAKECCTNAKKIIGQEYSSKELLIEILKDKEFYIKSGGGITFSGGEPFLQYDFLLECLKECKKEELHIAIETTGFANIEKILSASKYIDLIFYDIKHMDAQKHKKLTGVSNDIILHNFRTLTQYHKNIIARIPLIPSCNDDETNIRRTSAFAANCGVGRLEILPYHKLGVSKYQQLGREYQLPDCQTPSKTTLNRLLHIAREEGENRNMDCVVLNNHF